MSAKEIIPPQKKRTCRASEPDAEVTIEESGGGILPRPTARFPKADLDEVAGCLRSKRKPKTPAQMRTAIGREVIRRHDRGRY